MGVRVEVDETIHGLSVIERADDCHACRQAGKIDKTKLLFHYDTDFYARQY